MKLTVWAFTTRPGLAPAGDSLSLASPRESKQREGDPQSGSLRYASGNLRCSIPAGVRRTRLSPQTTAALIPPPSALLGPARTGLGQRNRERGAERAKRVLRNLAVGISSPTPSVCAEERRARRIRARDCLSRRRVRARPRLDRAPQGARSAAKGRRQQGRLSFGDFSLAKQRKVTSRRATPGLLAKGNALKVQAGHHTETSFFGFRPNLRPIRSNAR